MAAARVEDLLKELDQSMEQFTVSVARTRSTKSSTGRQLPPVEPPVATYPTTSTPRVPMSPQLSTGPGPRPSPAQYTPVVNGVPPPIQRVPPVVVAQNQQYYQQVQQQQRYQEEYAQYQIQRKDEEVSKLREELERAKIELERQRSMSASASQYSGGGYSGGTKKTSIHSGDSGSGSTSLSKALKSRAVSTKTAAKSAYGWTGKCSVRQPGKICDLILDEACNLEHDPVPYSICYAIANEVKDFYYQKTDKGKGANQAIMSIMYMINLEDPELVHRGMEVLSIMYELCGPIFWQNVYLNLDFFVHFFETRKHLTDAEKENVKFLCGIFANWYVIDVTSEINFPDPTIKIKQFFEGLLRAGYEFPPTSLDAIPRDKLASIQTSWFGGAFSFTKYKK
ncbi:hypothetical protein HDU79_008671 [Rhizoclosmatium sp. JEL0117]|nr:hypothetical protein HDU79_008671 [Rhizoclosmatium sp. JEL0117]